MSKEEDNLKSLKTQACVMRVNICCDGCQKKVKKVLHKIDGVYTVSINVEERKVTVVGNVNPDILIKKLNKTGKHAELLSSKGGGGGKGQSLTSQLQKLQLEHQLKEHGQAQKDGSGGGGGGKEQKGQPVRQTVQLQEGKGFKDLKLLSFKDLKIPFKKDNHKAAAKLDLPSKEELDDGSDLDDDEDDYDEFDDDEDLDDMDEYSDEELYENPKMMKPSNLRPKGSGVAKDKKGSGGDHKGGEGSEKGNGGDGAHDSKNGGGNKKGGNSNNNAGNHAHNGKSSSDKGGGSNNNVGGGLPIGQPHIMGQFGNMQPPMGLMATNNAQGLPAGAYFPPEMMVGQNPYQQQYLQLLMQQQRMMMNGQDRPSGYGYGPPVCVPQQHPYSMFSDENPNGCLIM